MKKIVSSCSLLLSIMMVMQNTVHAQWMRVNPVPYLGTIAFGIYNGKVIALTSDTTGMYISTDDGADWLPDSTGIKKSIQAIGVRGSYIFVAPYGVGVYRSTDGGVSWASANKGITNPYIYAFACTDSAIFAGAGNNGNSGGTIFRSTDSGATWVEVKNGLGGGGPSFTEMATKGDTVFAGSNVALYRTTNNGQSWKILNIGAIYTAVSPVFVHDTTIYVSKNLNDEVYRSTDNGDSWLEMGTGLPTATNSNGIYLTAYASNDTVVFSGIYGGGVYISVDHGMTWSSANFGLTDLSVYSLIISGNYLIAGTSNGIWRRALSDFITTDVKQNVNGDIVNSFVLNPNYPNPFTQATTISYVLPQNSHVSLAIYNAIGEKIAVLVNVEQTVGEHSAIFSAHGLQSGIYYYRLTAGKYSQAGTMTIVR